MCQDQTGEAAESLSFLFFFSFQHSFKNPGCLQDLQSPINVHFLTWSGGFDHPSVYLSLRSTNDSWKNKRQCLEEKTILDLSLFPPKVMRSVLGRDPFVLLTNQPMKDESINKHQWFFEALNMFLSNVCISGFSAKGEAKWLSSAPWDCFHLHEWNWVHVYHS